MGTVAVTEIASSRVRARRVASRPRVCRREAHYGRALRVRYDAPERVQNGAYTYAASRPFVNQDPDGLMSFDTWSNCVERHGPQMCGPRPIDNVPKPPGPGLGPKPTMPKGPPPVDGRPIVPAILCKALGALGIGICAAPQEAPTPTPDPDCDKKKSGPNGGCWFDFSYTYSTPENITPPLIYKTECNYRCYNGSWYQRDVYGSGGGDSVCPPT